MSVEGARPAERLLLNACASVVGKDPDEARQPLPGVPDWDEVAELALRHGLRPLLYRYLQAGETVPERVEAELASHYQANARHNLLLTKLVVDLVARFGAEGVETVPFKGPVLAQEAYGSLLLREFNDLDVVVRERDARRAMDALRAEGYTLHKGRDDTRHGYHRRFLHPRTGVKVELHWGFTQEFLSIDLDLEEVWARTRTVSVAGQLLPGFSLEDTLLLLCVHGAKHLWLGLGWICDVAGLLARRPDVAWGPLLARAENAGCGRMVRLGLYLAHELLEAPLPAWLAAELGENRQVRALTNSVSARLFPVDFAAVGVPEQFVFYLRVRERFRDRARLQFWLLRLLFTPIPEDRAAVPLPRPFHWLYPLVRPTRLVSLRWRKRG